MRTAILSVYTLMNPKNLQFEGFESKKSVVSWLLIYPTAQCINLVLLVAKSTTIFLVPGACQATGYSTWYLVANFTC